MNNVKQNFPLYEGSEISKIFLFLNPNTQLFCPVGEMKRFFTVFRCKIGCKCKKSKKVKKLPKTKEEKKKIAAKRQQYWEDNFGVFNVKQRHIPRLSLDILRNKEKFEELCKIHSNRSLANLLKVSKTLIEVTKRKYGLQKLYKSTYEPEIKNFLLENNLSFIFQDHIQLKPLELDFWFPDLNFAIEFQGDYYHLNPKIFDENSNCFGTPAREIWADDEYKLSLCKEKGIELMRIWECDWNENKVEIKEKILRKVLPQGIGSVVVPRTLGVVAI
jgi:hypothetical protein